MSYTEEIVFDFRGLSVRARVTIEPDDDVTPGSVEVEEIVSVEVEDQDALIEYLGDKLLDAAHEEAARG